MSNTTQQTVLALVPKLSGGLGFPCGLILSYYIWRDQRSGKGNPMLRALLSISCYEMVDAFSWFLSTWAAPRDTEWVWASGTQASCNLQGFGLQFVIGAPLSSCALAFYFYLVVIHDQTPQDLAKVEVILLFCIFGYALLTSVIMLLLEQYNHIGAVCWVQGSPPLCGNSVFNANPDIPCDRGEWAWVYGMVLFFIPLWICFVLIFYFNVSIYLNIRNTPEGKWFAKQSFLYGMAFFIIWAPSTLWSTLHWKDGGSFWLDLASAIFEPLTGFWNLCIFLHNRPKTRRQLFLALQSVLCCGLGGWLFGTGHEQNSPDDPNMHTMTSDDVDDSVTEGQMPQTPGEVKKQQQLLLEQQRRAKKESKKKRRASNQSLNDVPEEAPLPREQAPPRSHNDRVLTSSSVSSPQASVDSLQDEPFDEEEKEQPTFVLATTPIPHGAGATEGGSLVAMSYLHQSNNPRFEIAERQYDNPHV